MEGWQMFLRPYVYSPLSSGTMDLNRSASFIGLSWLHDDNAAFCCFLSAGDGAEGETLKIKRQESMIPSINPS
ncbi:hypothetical protein WJ0W_006486 [Paenibacillus melissococcoides]|uniref:Uncharacterized protein n=1 Tax=Paenibacillus melissococcoides TaxID=2912268 RepID=A0ABM9GC89_9BACL|nr:MULTISPECIES: hypothetical protein [Paenibacillus]MEB9894484.1 hypothetical protein [Bacillus cereus]GIO76788.1 hypothetical protein J6TS7_03980 [Paenibacillus dendritiformis]CAH8249300.1 hypothetical protein WJ0W_006486 [Paenibacillus melissococcoides]